MEKPLVSVLMTAYNREKYIKQAIESVLASTYKNFELIIVDDNSKDKTVEIVKSYEINDNRIKVFINEKNVGDYPNRNKAATYAKGKYLKYVDADDLIYPYGLEQLVFFMEQFPNAGYGLCSLKQDKNLIYPFQLSPQEAYKRHYFSTSLFHKAPLSSIIRKEAFNAIGGFTGKRMLGDFEMWHLLSQKFPVVLMPEGIVWYREHEEQEMALHRKDPMEPFKYLLIAKGILLSEMCPLGKDDGLKALKLIDKKIAASVVSAIRHHPWRKMKELKRASGYNWIQLFLKRII